jgi:glycosyltransferase involved in cell wall biosynthesis
VHTYAYESFGRIFIEAMAHGIPVVAAQGGGASELIQDGENGFLFDPEDVATAAQRILTLFESPKTYQKLVENGRSFAGQFRSEVVGQQILDVYDALV